MEIQVNEMTDGFELISINRDRGARRGEICWKSHGYFKKADGWTRAMLEDAARKILGA